MPKRGTSLQGLLQTEIDNDPESEEEELELENEGEDVGDENNSDGDDDKDDAGEDKPETARETVERVLRESQQADNGDSGAPEEAKTQSENPVKDPVEKKTESIVEIKPPQRLTAQQKEVFNKLPPELKSPYADMINQQEAKFTQRMQQAAAKETEAAHVIEAVRPYLLAHPELQEQGYTESKIVSALLGVHQRLTNPKTAKGAFLDIAAQIGVDVDAVSEAIDGGGTTTPALPPEISALQDKINTLESYINGVQSANTQMAAEQITAELQAVINEKDAAGGYLYPELHDADFLQRAEPLVSTLRASIPGLNYGDALRRAYTSLTGKSPQQTQSTRLLGDNNNILRAKKAAVSVRGKSSPNVNVTTAADDIPESALKNARATTEWAIQQLRKGA